VSSKPEYQDSYVRFQAPDLVDTSSLVYSSGAAPPRRLSLQWVPREEVGSPEQWLVDRSAILESQLGVESRPFADLSLDLGHAILRETGRSPGEEATLYGIVDSGEPFLVSVVAWGERPERWKYAMAILESCRMPGEDPAPWTAIVTPRFHLEPDPHGSWEGRYGFSGERGETSVGLDLWYGEHAIDVEALLGVESGPRIEKRIIEFVGAQAEAQVVRTESDGAPVFRGYCLAGLESGRWFHLFGDYRGIHEAGEAWTRFAASVTRRPGRGNGPW